MKYMRRFSEFKALAKKRGLAFRVIGTVKRKNHSYSEASKESPHDLLASHIANKKRHEKSFLGLLYPMFRIDWKPRNWKHKICFAGVVHGDEVSGVWGIRKYLQKSNLPENIWLTFFPILNPYGYEFFKRKNGNNENLNKEWFSKTPPTEIKNVKKSIGREKFDAFVSFHENNWKEEEDFYIYYYGNAAGKLAKKIADEIKKMKLCKLDRRISIDGHPASHGLVAGMKDNSFECWMYKMKISKASIAPEIPSKTKFLHEAEIVKRIVELVAN